MKAEDITGKKYNNLTAIEPTEIITKTEGRVWKWRCDCGRVIELPVQRVRQGRTKSCGCLREITTNTQRKDITGQVFGRLTAIRPTELRDRKEVVWEFRCECGNTVYRAQNLVSKGGCSSCGCLGRENQKELFEKMLQRNFVMGTNISKIAASEEDLSVLNRTGVKGVLFDRTRGCYVAHLGFQNEKYRLRCSSMAEAKAVRKQMKELHYAFLKWWDQLSEGEQLEWDLRYDSERKAQAEAFREMLRQWREEYPVFFPEEDNEEDSDDDDMDPGDLKFTL